MKNLIVDQCQLESAPSIQLKSTFKTDHGAVDIMHGSPEGSESECSESITKAATSLNDPQHGSSVPSSEQSRPSPEVEVEVVAAPPEESVSSLRSNRGSSGRHHHHRSGKRKYEELSSVPSTNDGSIVGLDNNPHHSTDNSSSNESATIQDPQHQDGMSDPQTEAEVARWKRIYAGSMENDSLQVKRISLLIFFCKFLFLVLFC